MKNAFVYTFAESSSVTKEVVESAIADNPCPDLGSQSTSITGMVPLNPGESEDEVWSVHASGMVYGVFQELFKKIPPDVLKREVDKRLTKIRTQEGRIPGRAEKAEIREAALFSLLPKAFIQSKRIGFVVDLESRLMWVDAGSAKAAEMVAAALMKSIDDLAFIRPQPDCAPISEMTKWTSDETQAPEGFQVGDECQMKDQDSSGQAVTIKGIELQQGEVCAHLENGLATVKIQLIRPDQLIFKLDENLDMKSIKLAEELKDEIMGEEAETARESYQATLLLQGSAIREALVGLHAHFGANKS